jgi:hypothetical protein
MLINKRVKLNRIMINRGDKMRIKLFAILVFLLILPISFAQVTPPPVANSGAPVCDEIVISNRIQQEHQLTRKFIVDTVNTKTADFFKQADDRISYIENEYESEMRNAVIKLGILWLAIAVFINGLFGIIRMLWQRRSYNKMKADISNDVVQSLKKEILDSAKVKGIEKPSVEMPKPEVTNPSDTQIKAMETTIAKEAEPKLTKEQLFAEIDNIGKKVDKKSQSKKQ